YATLDCWRLREPTEREHPSRGLDTHHGRASALVRNWLGTVKARIPPMVHVALAGDGVGVSAVVRQLDHGAVVFLGPEIVDVIFERLSEALDVVEHADLRAHPLRHPKRHGVGLRTSAADIHKDFERQQRVLRDDAAPYAPLRLGLCNLLGEIGALKRAHSRLPRCDRSARDTWTG